MYAIVEFLSADKTSSVALVHTDWFVDNKKNRVRCPNTNWYKYAKNWNPNVSMLKWKISKCQILKDDIGKLK